MRADVVVVGGGLIGAACADAVAGAGLRVVLLERGRCAREASWAGAGVLHPIHPRDYPTALHPLLRAGLAEHRRLDRELRAESGRAGDLVESGLLVLGEAAGGLASWCGDDIEHRWVASGAALEPDLREEGPALFLPRACHVRPQRLTRALLARARGRGARIIERTSVRSIGEQGRSVRTDEAEIRAGRVILAAGAWSGGLSPRAPVRPVRGQILLYRATRRRMVILPDGRYAVPRKDGFVLFGSTVEEVGFDGRPTPAAQAELARRADAALGLKIGQLSGIWAGLRPATADRLPVLGPDPDRPGLLHAGGAYRNGILIGPLIGRILADLCRKKDPEYDLGPFAPRGAGPVFEVP